MNWNLSQPGDKKDSPTGFAALDKNKFQLIKDGFNYSQPDDSDEPKLNYSNSPYYTKITPGAIRPIRMGDSVSDVLSKLYNLIRIHDLKNRVLREIEHNFEKETLENEAHRTLEIGKIFKKKKKEESLGDKKGESKNSESKDKGLLDTIFNKIKDLATPVLAGGAIGAVVGAVASGVTELFSDDSGSADVTDNGKGMVGNKAAFYALDFFKSRGWTDEQAAGIVGNLQEESGNFDPNVISGKRKGDKGTAVGIAQWRGERQDNFEEKYHHKIEGSTLDEQLDFVDFELKGTHKRAGNSLKEATSPTAAAKIVRDRYEIPAPGGLGHQRRINNSISLYKKDKSRTETVVASTATNTSETPSGSTAIDPAVSSSSPANQTRRENKPPAPPPAPASAAGKTPPPLANKLSDVLAKNITPTTKPPGVKVFVATQIQPIIVAVNNR